MGVGRIQLKPAVVGDELKPLRMAWLSLTFDHRVIDGHTAAEFLRDLSQILESEERVRELSLQVE